MKINDHLEHVRRVLPQAFDYFSYRQMVDELFARGKTTGPNQSEPMLKYTELNIARMNKWDKHFKLPQNIAESLRNYDREETWLVLTEAWCGDAAHAVPIIARMAQTTDAIDLKFVLRDTNLPLMDMFLTDGGRSIPKLIRMDTRDYSVISTWGPRPLKLQQSFLDAKNRGDDMNEIKKQMQIWYARNRGQAIMDELAGQLELLGA